LVSSQIKQDGCVWKWIGIYPQWPFLIRGKIWKVMFSTFFNQWLCGCPSIFRDTNQFPTLLPKICHASPNMFPPRCFWKKTREPTACPYIAKVLVHHVRLDRALLRTVLAKDWGFHGYMAGAIFYPPSLFEANQGELGAAKPLQWPGDVPRLPLSHPMGVSLSLKGQHPQPSQWGSLWRGSLTH
jgi:hypothetical protein